MIKKQQKWIALFVALTFIWLMQVSTQPMAAASTTAKISSASTEQGPSFIEEPAGNPSRGKRRSVLPWILIGVGVITITILIVVLVVLKNYNIVGSWHVYLTSITYPGWEDDWMITFSGDKKSGTFTDSDGSYGTYIVDGKNITTIKYTDISLTFTGRFDDKDRISGTYTWTYYDEIGNWSGIRSGSGAAMPKSPSQFKEKKNRERLSRSN